VSLDDARRILRRIVVPVDLSPASRHQAAIAAGLSEAAGVPLILVHVIEPVKSPLAARLHLAGVEANRRAVAEDELQAIAAGLPPSLHTEALLAYGDPAEELAKVAHDRGAGLVVMGLNGSPMLGPRMGSVTYRMLCLVHTLVLALPPERMEALVARATGAAAAAVPQ
jgi:nucleotide-binding universal stress UspA family protein